MEIIRNSALNIYSMIMIVIIILHSRDNADQSYYNNRLFSKLLYITLLILMFDTISRFDGKPDTIFPLLNHFGNFMLFLSTPILPTVWFAYAHYQIYKEEHRTKKLLVPLLLINLVNVVSVIINLKNGWFYYIDAANIYHRGDYYLYSNMINIFLMIAAFIMIIRKRKTVEREYYFPLLFFSIPPLFGLIIQSFVYGIPIGLVSVVISMIIVFLNIQNQNLYTDYLTDSTNRRKLEIHINDKISTSSKKNTFSAIMIDIDDFKIINDTYGHDEGDVALRKTVQMIKSIIGPKDIVSRSGGDEFWIVLNTSDEEEVVSVVHGIKREFENYNELNNKPYELKFSYGYAVYDYDKKQTLEEFQQYVDNLMYENKRFTKNTVDYLYDYYLTER